MWKNWINGVLGLFVMFVPFINFSLAVERTVLILLGIVIAILGFWATSVSGEKSTQPGEVVPLAPPKPREPAITEQSTMPEHLGM